MLHACNASVWGQKNQEFTAILGFIANSELAWTTRDSASDNKQPKVTQEFSDHG